MLIKATLEDIKKYGEFAYSLALNPAKSCYPTYADGIKTKTDFFKAAEGAIAKKHMNYCYLVWMEILKAGFRIIGFRRTNISSCMSLISAVAQSRH
ncbi:MAG: hypothetical protein ACLR2E_07990 [Lachnospiraceae bacterium]